MEMCIEKLLQKHSAFIRSTRSDNRNTRNQEIWPFFKKYTNQANKKPQEHRFKRKSNLKS